MKIHYSSFSIFCILAFALSQKQSFAQAPLMTPEDAVALALGANFDIRISQANADIAQLNNTKGNAGMLPSVNFVANDNFTLSAFQQKLSNGNEFNAVGAPFNNANAGVQLAWTIFDGRRMNIVKSRLEQLEALGNLELQSMVQTTVANVLLLYYDVVRGMLSERALSEVIVLNEERLRIAEARLAAGFAAQTDALQARIDLNQRRADLLLQQTFTTANKRSLNRLLARLPETQFSVVETLATNYAPARSAILEKMIAQNPTLLSFQKSAEISALMVQENRTLGKARLTGITQLNVVRADNGAGFLLNNTQAGVLVGASLVVPLYTGGNVKRQVETAKVAAEQAHLRVEQQRLFIETELENQLANLQVQQQIMTIEEESVKAARENLSVSTERFRVGTTTGLEPQIAQNSLEQALDRRNQVLYQLKLAELRLKLLAGEL